MTFEDSNFLAASYRRNPDLIGASIDDELVMMSVEQGQYYKLGGVGARIWELLEQPSSVHAMIEQLLQEFNVDRDVCARDVGQFLGQMEQLGLVERS